MTRISRVVPWCLMGLLAVILTFATWSLVAMERSRPDVLELPEQVAYLYGLAIPLTFGLVAALIIRSQPRHPQGWLFGVVALLVAVGHVLELYTQWYPGNDGLRRLHGTVSAPLFGLLVLILLLFPDGRPPTPRWRPVVAFLALVTAATTLVEAAGSTVAWAGPTESAFSFVEPLALALGVVSLWTRWRHATGPTRQQIKWLMLGAAAFGVELTLGLTLELLHMSGEDAGASYIGQAIFVLTVCLIPAAMGIGIVRHHLYDVDRLLSRTIGYGLLLIAALALYVVFIAVFAAVLASRNGSPTWLAIATTAAAVLTLRPVWRRLVDWADRRIYGTRTEPVEMMAAVASELAAYPSPEDGLSGLAEAAQRATRARGALVRIELPDGADLVVEAGDSAVAGARTSVPIRVDGAAVGSITVVDPSRHSAGRTLLSHLASLAAPAVADIRTIAELRALSSQLQAGNAELAASQSRLAHAEEQERAHLRHMVQSEVLPAVLDLRAGLPTSDAVRTGRVSGEDLEDAARRSRELAGRIRGMAHDVLPPVLADRGLAAGLRAHLIRLNADVAFAASGSDRLPASVEAALYECGRLLVDAATATAGHVVLTLTVTPEQVQLAVTCPATEARVARPLPEHALLMVGDRLAVLGGAAASTASGRVTEVRCHVPLGPVWEAR